MMRRIVLHLLFLLWSTSTLALPEVKVGGVSLGYGIGKNELEAGRIAVQWPWEQQWCTTCFASVGGFVEASLAHIRSNPGPQAGSHTNLTAYAVTPVFRITRNEPFGLNLWPYAELGIGLSWLSESEIGGRTLGLHGQFEDRMGIGVRFGEHHNKDLTLRFMHFSNGFLGADNSGFNVYYLNLGYFFDDR